jgi:hypothetical protein
MTRARSAPSAPCDRGFPSTAPCREGQPRPIVNRTTARVYGQHDEPSSERTASPA